MMYYCEEKKMSKILYLSVFVILNFLLVKGQIYTSVIETASGPVRGVISTTIESIDYAAFKGIPYAKPPVGDLRFKPPVEVDSWVNVHDAASDGSICTQYNSTNRSAVGSEDCLFINVYTPHTEFNGSVSKPVMVWIYGGSFTTGNSNESYYGPDFILGEDVIMVSFNYRVSALGFINLEHENATGNYGLKDQNLALKWVKKNIAQFGGNPDNITIFGQSAGSVSVDLQVLSDMSVGLFNQAISMSGSALCLYWGFQSGAEAVEQAFLLGTKLGINTLSKETLLETLYNASAADIVIAANDIGLIPFRPSLEKTDIATDQEKFLTKCSLSKYITGNYTKGPHMMGFTANETVFFAEHIDDLLKMTSSALSSTGSVRSHVPLFSDITNAIDMGVSGLDEHDIYQLAKQTTDLFFVLGIDTKQRFMSRNNDYPIYYYRFSFDYIYSLHKTKGIKLDGVGHMDDVPYLLYMPSAELPLNNSEIAITRKRIVKMWTNFAKYGNPTPNGEDDEILGITWPDSRAHGEHLEISKDLTTGSRPTNAEVKRLQLSELGASPVFSDCKKNLLSDIINSLVSIVSLLG